MLATLFFPERDAVLEWILFLKWRIYSTTTLTTEDDDDDYVCRAKECKDLPFSRSNLDACEEECKWGFSVLDVELNWVHIPCPWAALASSNSLAANSMCIGWCVLILGICCMAGRAKRTGCRCAIWGSTASAEQWTIAFLLSQETSCWYQASKQKQVRLGFTVYGLSVCLSVCLPTSPCWHCCGSNFYSA